MPHEPQLADVDHWCRWSRLRWYHLDVSRSQLGELAQYELLNLRRWAHMLGFRGHFMTKSRVYSTTSAVPVDHRSRSRRTASRVTSTGRPSVAAPR